MGKVNNITKINSGKIDRVIIESQYCKVFSERKAKNQCVEKITKEYFESKGYIVIRGNDVCLNYYYDKKDITDKECRESYPLSTDEYYNKIDKILKKTGLLKKVKNSVKEFHSYQEDSPPDFLIFNSKKIFWCEVKSHNDGFKFKQLKFALRSPIPYMVAWVVNKKDMRFYKHSKDNRSYIINKSPKYY
jgi:hypothetical protein